MLSSFIAQRKTFPVKIQFVDYWTDAESLCTTLDVGVSETTSRLLERLQERGDIPVRSRLELRIANKTVRDSEDDVDLLELGVRPGDTIRVVITTAKRPFFLRLGSGVAYKAGRSAAFVDVSHSGGMTRHAWSTDCPSWRVTRPGLCLEGRCRNDQCKAHGEMVVMNKAFNDFDLIRDADSTACPECKQKLPPSTCAFNNCMWKFDGRKTGQVRYSGRRPIPFSHANPNPTYGGTHACLREPLSGRPDALMVHIQQQPVVIFAACVGFEPCLGCSTRLTV